MLKAMILLKRYEQFNFMAYLGGLMGSKSTTSKLKFGSSCLDENTKTIYLIDGTAYIYRAFHAIRNLSNSKGFPTNAAFGFTRMLMKLINDKSPEYAAMFFESKGPTFRPPITRLIDRLPLKIC